MYPLSFFPAPDYPQQIIGLVDSGIQSSGQGITFSASSASNSPGHIAVDTIGRMVYWFHPSTRIICRQSLNGGEIDVSVCMCLCVHVMIPYIAVIVS